MKRRAAYFVIILFMSVPVYGQAHSGIELQGGVSRCTGTALTGMLTIFQKISKNIVVTAGLGYSEFNGKPTDLELNNRIKYPTKGKVKTVIPFHIGGRFYFAESGFNPGVIVEFGINRVGQEKKISVSGVPGQSPAVYETHHETITDFSYGLGFSALIPIGEKLNVDISFVAHQEMEIRSYTRLLIGMKYNLR